MNRTPEQRARETIDAKLEQAGWKVQSKNRIDFNAGPGIAVREYQTDVGPADYLLFIDRKPVGVIEAKPEDWGQKIPTIEEQSTGYADAERADLPALALKRWDVLFNEGGDRDKLGRGWIWESQVELCITQNHVFRASPFLCSVEHSKWISHWGNSFGQRYFETQGKQTTNLASINKTVLSKFPIPLPPVIEQVEILRRLDLEASRLSRMDQNITAALRKLDALRQAILKKAFSGGLVPQDPSDEPASVFLDRIRADRAQVTKRSTTRKTGKRRTPKTTV